MRIVGRRWLSAHRARNAGLRRECWVADAPAPSRPVGDAREYSGLDIPAICHLLDERRQRRQMTKRDLSRAAGVSEQQVAKLLDPARFGEPQLATALRVAQALGLTLDGLLGLPVGTAMVSPGEDPIAHILAARGWTMQQLGREAGLSHGTVPAIVAGKSRPDLLTAHALARAGGVSLDSLARAL
ncbi:MAG: helix-turn-helix domain-containing protein [Gammaproteobacteria bacterium]|nr:helix-turn-helix domain-containing protein [Gammaproteobacteria bacterium]